MKAQPVYVRCKYTYGYMQENEIGVLLFKSKEYYDAGKRFYLA
jgi:hypothetical protein